MKRYFHTFQTRVPPYRGGRCTSDIWHQSETSPVVSVATHYVSHGAFGHLVSCLMLRARCQVTHLCCHGYVVINRLSVTVSIYHNSTTSPCNPNEEIQKQTLLSCIHVSYMLVHKSSTCIQSESLSNSKQLKKSIRCSNLLHWPCKQCRRFNKRG